MEAKTTSEGNSEKASALPPRKALEGVKVLEWADLVSGPYCSKLLADLGADVIKIEKPGKGDESRSRGEFIGHVPHLEKSLLFLYVNTNKSGIALDAASPSEREKFIQLVQWADIFIHDKQPQILNKLKLSYRYLRQINPGLVMTSITPFGQTGPYQCYKAYPINTYSGGGLGHLSPQIGPNSNDPPVRPGGLFMEYGSGLVSAAGTLAALYARQATGVGQEVDVSKQEALLSLCRVQIDRYPNEGLVQSRFDSTKAMGCIFQCKDGYIVEMILQAREWHAFARFLNKPEWENNQYGSMKFRTDHWDEIEDYVSEWMLEHEREKIYHKGQALGCPVSPIMTSEDIVNSEQSKAREFFRESDHPVAGRLTYPMPPYRMSATPPSIERTAPLLGQDTDDIFSSLIDANPEIPLASSRNTETVNESATAKKGPLAGVRVADFAWAWAGAYATELLAFLGAEVIKVESKRHVDPTRLGSLTTGQEFNSVNESPVFNDINLGKLSIEINLSHPEGIKLAKQLVSVSDVVTQNMRPGVMERLGLGYESLRDVRPDIIYLSSSARGSSGPERRYSGYAPNFAAFGGISYITGQPNGKPSYIAGEVDLLSAVTSAFAILAALNHRLRTGEGQEIDVSSAESINVLIGEVLMDYTTNRKVQTRCGNLDDFMAPHNFYRCRGNDKWVSIAIATDEEWEAFKRVLGRPDWIEDERFSTLSGRLEHRVHLDRLIEEWTKAHTHYEIMEILQEADVAAVPCFSSDELYDDPHLNHRQCWTKIFHPMLKEQSVLTSPWKFSETPATIGSAAPLFGQHTDQVFKELLGLEEDEIMRLREQEVIY
ncbi:MAG: CoA transferase [Desulfatiglans sp.]|jgi:crotonobetainyl-CoA:carnitine CoA-transferase CaiB-like acyl-CoA transferase|nr:CoA transferase [Thermodesulfobacteriota bacterium]MEE4354036.1 CoA transferase [Desulfatiglans sp.]